MHNYLSAKQNLFRTLKSNRRCIRRLPSIEWILPLCRATTVGILFNDETAALLEKLQKVADLESATENPLHINLLSPFAVPQQLDEAANELFALLSKMDPIEITLSSLAIQRVSKDKRMVVVKVNSTSRKSLLHLFQAMLHKLGPEFSDISFNPVVVLGCIAHGISDKLKRLSKLWSPITITVDAIHILHVAKKCVTLTEIRMGFTEEMLDFEDREKQGIVKLWKPVTYGTDTENKSNSFCSDASYLQALPNPLSSLYCHAHRKSPYILFYFFIFIIINFTLSISCLRDIFLSVMC